MLSFLGVGSRRASTIPPAGSASAASSSATSSLASADGRPTLFVKEGWMSKEGEVFKTWHKRFFRLSGLTLSYYTDKEQVKGVIPLHNALLRDSHRRGMEAGFELVVNPSASAREGSLLLTTHGDLQYLSGASPRSGNSSPRGGIASSSLTSSALSDPQQSQGEERIYYLCVEAASPALALLARREWISALQNNIAYECSLRSWIGEREDRFALALTAARREVEQVRAEREMEQLARQTEANEARALKREQDEARELDAIRHANLAAAAEAAAKVEAPERVVSPPIEDAALMSGSLSGTDLVAALKRKNQALERDVRMIVAENEALKAAALAQATSAANNAKKTASDHNQQMSVQIAATTAAQQHATEAVAAAAAASRRASLDFATLGSVAALPASPSAVGSTVGTASGTADLALASPATFDPSPLASTDSAPNSTSSSTAASPTKPEQPSAAATAAAPATPTSAQVPLPAAPATPTSAAAAAAASGRGGPRVACLCACAPPCVPFSAHKASLVHVNGLENRLASVALERQSLDQVVQRYRGEKKVLKQEVLRLRTMLQQTDGGAPSPASANTQ